jgi:hypothetical protein
MEPKDYWQLFLETGAPEMYLLYARQQKLEAMHVFDGSGNRTQGNRS